MDEKTGGTLKLARPETPKVQALRVTVTRGPDRGASAVVDRRGIIVGRATGAGLHLTDGAVSSFHVELMARPEGLLVRDLSSHNGTFFAGARIASATVPPESTLEVGASTLEVKVEAGLAPPEDERASFGPMRCASSAMRTLFARLARIAPTELSVLLEGPAGTGKELAARAIHEASSRAKGPFVVVDCATIPSELTESVLFGHEPEVGTEGRSTGVFDAADGGTLLLKEPGDLATDLQPKLLRVLETREVTSAGAARGSRPIRVRVLASTRQDLRERVNTATFREDLYLRLAQARAVLPPLGARTEDISPLAQHFLRSLPVGVEGARDVARDALEELTRREYPGNVRELRNTVERASLLAKGPTITTGDLAFERLLSAERERATRTESVELEPFKDAKRSLVDEFERDYLKALLLRTGDNLSRASAISGVERHHLRNLFRKHALWEK
jgi:DNA-binding NtrC family response regulator